MLTKKDIQEHIYLNLFSMGMSGLAVSLYWFAGDRNTLRKYIKQLNPDCYHAITTKKINIPTLINHPEEYIRMIARYRLQHNK
jgi:hypothetical protein